MTEQHCRAPYTARIRPHLIALVFAVALLALPLNALTAPDAPPPLNGIAHVAIRVHNLAASTAFYQQLGFEQPFSLDKDGVLYESFIKINDHQFIELYPTTEKDPNPGFLHLCFEGEDLEAINQDYISRGLTPKPVRKAGAGNLLFTMAGPLQPSGPQNIEYTQYQPGSRHTLDQGKHLGPDRIADKLVSVALAMQDLDAARDFYVNQLEFKPLPGSLDRFHLPGDSGQQIQIIRASLLGDKGCISLETESLSKAIRILRKQHIAYTRLGDALNLADPDGNIIHIESR